MVVVVIEAQCSKGLKVTKEMEELETMGVIAKGEIIRLINEVLQILCLH